MIINVKQIKIGKLKKTKFGICLVNCLVSGNTWQRTHTHSDCYKTCVLLQWDCVNFQNNQIGCMVDSSVLEAKYSGGQTK